jgi:hypothetical protein
MQSGELREGSWGSHLTTSSVTSLKLGEGTRSRRYCISGVDMPRTRRRHNDGTVEGSSAPAHAFARHHTPSYQSNPSLACLPRGARSKCRFIGIFDSKTLQETPRNRHFERAPRVCLAIPAWTARLFLHNALVDRARYLVLSIEYFGRAPRCRGAS